jgi:hypothetical protein
MKARRRVSWAFCEVWGLCWGIDERHKKTKRLTMYGRRAFSPKRAGDGSVPRGEIVGLGAAINPTIRPGQNFVGVWSKVSRL